MRELSIFIDESGDFGRDTKSPFYIVTMVFHDQEQDISKQIQTLNDQLRNTVHGIHPIHVGPLIRREAFYYNDPIEERQHIFQMLFHMVRRLPITYTTVEVVRNSLLSNKSFEETLATNIKNSLQDNLDYLQSFDKIILYYDNGQRELSKLLFSVFSTLPLSVEFRTIRPNDYLLFQVADFLCTMSLIDLKMKRNDLTKSEQNFLGSRRDIKKNYLKYINKLHI